MTIRWFRSQRIIDSFNIRFSIADSCASRVNELVCVCVLIDVDEIEFSLCEPIIIIFGSYTHCEEQEEAESRAVTKSQFWFPYCFFYAIVIPATISFETTVWTSVTCAPVCRRVCVRPLNAKFIQVLMDCFTCESVQLNWCAVGASQWRLADPSTLPWTLVFSGLLSAGCKIRNERRSILSEENLYADLFSNNFLHDFDEPLAGNCFYELRREAVSQCNVWNGSLS